MPHRELPIPAQIQATILNEMADAVVVADGQCRIQYTNAACNALLGYADGELIGRHVGEFHSGAPEETGKFVASVREHLRSQGCWRGEFHNRRRDGTIFVTDARVTGIHTDEGSFWFVIQIDVAAKRYAERAAWESSQRISQLAATIREVIWLSTADFSELLYVSPAFEQIWGRSIDGLPANARSGFLETVHPDDRDAVVAAMQADLACGFDDERTREFRIVRPDGSVRWMRARYSPVRNEQGDVYRVAGVSTDITDQRRVTDELRMALAKNQAILSALPDLMFLLTAEGVFLEHHVANEADLFTPPEKFLGRNMREVLPPDLTQQIQRGFETVLEGGTPPLLEFGLPMPDGWRDYEARFVAIQPERQILTIVRDITRRKRAEGELLRAHAELEQRVQERTEELRRSEARLLEAQRIARLGNWERNLETNELHWSTEVFRIFGLSPEHSGATFETFLERVHPDDRPLVEKAVDRALNTGVPYNIHYRIVRPDGDLRFVHSQAEVTVDSSGRPLRMAGTVQDITERVRAEERTRKLQNDLAHVARVSTMGEMATGIAHEINQPLSAITNYVYAAQASLETHQLSNCDHVSSLLAMVTDQSLRAGEIVKRLRRLVRKAAPQNSAVDLNELIEDVLGMVQVDARLAEIEFVHSLDPALPLVVADSVQIQQVVLNLIRNAIDAVRGLEPSRRQIILSSGALNASEAEFSVQDFGTGIPQGISERIFEAFYTTKANGLGIGLAISRSIIESQNGRLWFESTAGEGSTFRFTLPFAEGNAVGHG